MFARFDENPTMTLQDIKETNITDGRTHGHTHGRTDGQRENSLPTTNKVCGGIMMKIHLKMKALECSQHFSHYKSMENIFQTFKGS